jgi:hypothetical protein
MSDEEIVSGKRWRNEIGATLDETDFGIICLTAANQHEPRLLFEAGALAKHLSVARVIPLYIDLDAPQVTGPLSDFQGRKLDKAGVWRIVQDINAATPKPLSTPSLQNLFELTWPGFFQKVTAAIDRLPEAEKPDDRSSESMLEEVLVRIRRIERNQRRCRARLVLLGSKPKVMDRNWRPRHASARLSKVLPLRRVH